MSNTWHTWNKIHFLARNVNEFCSLPILVMCGFIIVKLLSNKLFKLFLNSFLIPFDINLEVTVIQMQKTSSVAGSMCRLFCKIIFGNLDNKCFEEYMSFHFRLICNQPILTPKLMDIRKIWLAYYCCKHFNVRIIIYWSLVGWTWVLRTVWWDSWHVSHWQQAREKLFLLFVRASHCSTFSTSKAF